MKKKTTYKYIDFEFTGKFYGVPVNFFGLCSMLKWIYLEYML